MSRTRRLLVVAVAWAVPAAWIAAALLAGPSDGTSITSRTAVPGPERWGSEVTVARAYGDGSLRAGDIVLTIDGRSLDEWVGAEAPARRVGQTARYEVERAGGALPQILTITVTLSRYPLWSAVRDNPAAVLLVLLVLASGTAVFWRRPDDLSARAFLVATSLLPAAATAAPWGPGAIDLAGGRGVWPQAVGESLAVLGLGALVVAVATLADVPSRRWVLAPVSAVPLLGYLAWLPVALQEPDAVARLQAAATVLAPALLVTFPAVLVLAARAHRRADTRQDKLATRLVLLAVGACVLAFVLLEALPRAFDTDLGVAGDSLALVLVPMALAGIGVAITRDRVEEIEPAVRLALVRGSAVAFVGVGFLALVRAVDLASDLSVRSMLVGGAAALLLLPVAVYLQRALRDLVYGDRMSPSRLVSDLRRLDTLATPEEALQEMLAVLARRLHLAHASVDVFATGASGAFTAATGEPRGNPVTVDLAVGEVVVGRLRLDVDPTRDPFGPGDRRLLEDVGSQVGALVQVVSINRELQRSRQHLVSAREEERRRIRRDLHDGLGPSLAALAMRLEGLDDRIAEDPEEARGIVVQLSDQVREEIAEVRRVVEGLRPPALDQLGLVSALRQRADEHNLGAGPDRLAWTVEAGPDVEPLPAAVEVAAYRIAIEAVTNAARHSGGHTCTVSLSRTPSSLRVTVTDTGRGLAAGHAAGVGLFSMRERAEELGGTCTLTSRLDGGTVVDAVLPIVADGEGW